MKSWLNNLTMNVPQFPSGDLLTAIDNGQVLTKKWTVRKDNRAKISVLTSVSVWHKLILKELYNGNLLLLCRKLCGILLLFVAFIVVNAILAFF